jgi:hypothetical protein
LLRLWLLNRQMGRKLSTIDLRHPLLWNSLEENCCHSSM